MWISLNGERRALEPGAGVTLPAVLALLDIEPGARGVAVAVDGAVVPRQEWAATQLDEGARVEVLTAAQGG
jgi:sulfur carrier protein